MISSHHLSIFEAVAREGSIGGAASLLGYTQSTVSHHLAALEAQLGTSLFVRGRRGVELTDRGRVLRDHAELVLTQLAAAERAVQDSATLREGTLRVATFATAGSTFVPRLLAEFREEHPGVRITVQENEAPEETLADVRSRRTDVGFLFTTPDYWVRPLPGIALHRLFADPFLVALPLGHPMSGQATVPLSELATERWVTARAGDDPCAVLLDRACAAAGFEPDVAVRVDDYGVVGSCVRAGLGIALVPRLAVPQLREGLAVLELADEPIRRDVHAVLLGDGSSITATTFMRRVRQLAREGHPTA